MVTPATNIAKGVFIFPIYDKASAIISGNIILLTKKINPAIVAITDGDKIAFIMVLRSLFPDTVIIPCVQTTKLKMVI
jgi:hypothetical protein